MSNTFNFLRQGKSLFYYNEENPGWKQERARACQMLAGKSRACDITFSHNYVLHLTLCSDQPYTTLGNTVSVLQNGHSTPEVNSDSDKCDVGENLKNYSST